MKTYKTEERAFKRASVLSKRYGISTGCIRRERDGVAYWVLSFDPEVWELS